VARSPTVSPLTTPAVASSPRRCRRFPRVRPTPSSSALGLLAHEAGVSLERLLEQTERFSHGTTIGTNLMVERKGAHVGLLATAGHGDALLMMRGNGRTAGVTPDRVFDVGASDKPRSSSRASGSSKYPSGWCRRGGARAA